MAASSAAEYNRPQPMSYEDQQRMIQATQVARMHRRSMPPRCNPFAILLIVISCGMMFIGVTMTIISHWPGATQIGEDPLKIAGPVLFGIGGLLVVFCVILIYFLNERERRKWDENVVKLATTKLNSIRDSQLSSDADKSAGVSTGPAYYSNVDSSDDPRRSQPGERGVDVLPDPRKGSRSDGYAASGDSDAATVPVPLRVTKKRRSTQPRGDVSASDASVGSADLAPGMTSTLRQDPSSGGPQAYANLSYEGDTPEGQRHRKPPKQPAGPDGDKEGKRRRHRGGGPATADPIRDPVMRNVAAQQLHVHIKAQPGTAVHITPSSTPPTRPGIDEAPAYHARPTAGYQTRPPASSGAESETEI